MVRYPLPCQKTDNKSEKAGGGGEEEISHKCDGNGQPCVAEITCQVCKLNTHLADSCEFLYTPCSRKDCSGIRIIKTSNTLKNTGRKFLKCQYNCPNFQWLEDAVEEQVSGKKTNKNKYSTTSRGQTPRLVGSNQGQRPRGMRDRIRMKVNLDEVSGKFSILMIIKGLFRRYERWNPVHPTSGAFWGMGIGIGCGVGWGPGFGPDVVGYVGAGCGIGFSVGITLAGIGIGLPANFLIEFPFNAFRATGTSALGFAGDGWNYFGPQLSGFQKETKRRMSNFNQKHSLGQGVDLSEMKRRLTFHAKSLMESSQAITNRDSQSRNGTQPS